MFLMMTGAKNLMSHGDALSMKLPSKGGFTKNKINYVKVRLNGHDLYDLEFGRVYGSKFTEISNFEDVFVENLRELFTSETGLDVSL